MPKVLGEAGIFSAKHFCIRIFEILMYNLSTKGYYVVFLCMLSGSLQLYLLSTHPMPPTPPVVEPMLFEDFLVVGLTNHGAGDAHQRRHTKVIWRAHPTTASAARAVSLRISWLQSVFQLLTHELGSSVSRGF